MKRIVFLIGFMVSVLTASALTTNFTAVFGNWGDGGNWDNGVPGSGDDAVISGSTAFIQVTASANCQSLTISNGGTFSVLAPLTVVNDIDFSSNATSFTLGATTLNLGGDFLNSGSATIGFNGSSTVQYSGASAQAVLAASYGDLTFSGAGLKTIGDNTSVSGTFIGSTSTSVTFNTSTTTTILVGSYNDLTLDGTGEKQIDGDLTVNGTFSVDATDDPNVTYNSSSAQSVFAATYTGDLTFSGGGQKNISGSVIVDGTFSPGGGTVAYTGDATQAVLSGTYEDLVFSGDGNKTISSSITATTFTANTSTVEFNSTDATQNISSLGSAFYNMVISGSGTKQFIGDVDIDGDLTITSSTLSLGTGDLTLAGNFANNSAFTHNSKKVTFDGSAGSVISGSSSTTFNEIALAKTGGAVLSASSTVNIESTGTVYFDNAFSSWTATNFVFNSSDDDEGSRIDEVPTGSTITGDLTYNRFINSSSRRWWTLGVPMSNVAVSEAQDDFKVTGSFTDSSVIIGSNDYVSLVTYNEADLGDFDDGYVQFPLSAAAENFSKGVGYAAFIRDDTTSTVGTRTLDVTGTPYYDDYTFSLGYSTGGTDGDEGWNLISNPYASAISWTTGWSKTDIQTEAYIWNGSSWSAVSTIAPFQAFFVKGTSSSRALTIMESAKVTDAFTLGKPQGVSDVLEISIKDESHAGMGDQTSYIEKTQVVFDPASLDIYEGELDASYLPRNMFNRLQGGATLVDIKTGDESGNWYMKNTLPLTVTQRVIPISVVYTESETYSLSFYKQNFTSDATLYLRDNYTNTTVEVTAGTKYDFVTDANVLSKSGDRFELLAAITPLSQEEEFSTLINVYPIPASDQLYARGLTKSMTATIISTEGMEVTSLALDQDNNMMDVSSLERGVYILNLKNGNEMITEKIIIE